MESTFSRTSAVRNIDVHEALAEQGLRDEPRRDIGGELLGVIGVDGELHSDAIAVGFDLGDAADIDSAHLDVGMFGQRVSDVVGVEVYFADAGERLVVHGDGAADERRHDDDEQDGKEATSGR